MPMHSIRPPSDCLADFTFSLPAEFFDDQGYMLRYDSDTSTKVITSLFVTHPRYVERSDMFSEVLLIDTTHRTNLIGMPVVHMAGIDQLCVRSKPIALRSFLAAFAVVISEMASSCSWVLEGFDGTVWCSKEHVIPGILVTDDDRRFWVALDTAFPTVPGVLCAWHIIKNFESKIIQVYE